MHLLNLLINLEILPNQSGKLLGTFQKLLGTFSRLIRYFLESGQFLLFEWMFTCCCTVSYIRMRVEQVWGITREDLDGLAMKSHEKKRKARRGHYLLAFLLAM